MNLGTYALIAGVLWLIALARERYRQETRAALLEAQLSEARLRALQGQLQPHFLFNTLNMVAGLIREHRNDTAVDAIAELAELLRRTLRDIERQEVTLGEELAWLDVYLSIQKRRFGALLNLQDDIAPDVRSALIPPFLLQPIVENAVMHGLERSSGGTIILRASRSHGALRLEVEDNGAGIRPNYVEGVGLRATRDRLDARHGAAASLVVTDAIPHGTLVRITLPDGVQ